MIVPCRGVHMYFMTYPIDVALMDGDGAVVALYRDLAPGARTRWHAAAHHALEVPAGTLAETNTKLGDRVVWEPHPRLGGSRLSEDTLERQGRQN